MSISTFSSGFPYPNGSLLAIDNNNNIYLHSDIENFYYFHEDGDIIAFNIYKIDSLGNKSVFLTYTLNGNDRSLIPRTSIIFDKLSFPNGYLYFMDRSEDQNIKKIDVNGNITPVITNGEKGIKIMTFNNNNDLYYACFDNNIYKLNKLTGNATTFINGNGVLNYITTMAFDSLNNLYVASHSSGNYIYKFDSNGNLINNAFIYKAEDIIANDCFWWSIVFDKYDNIYTSYGNDADNYARYISKYNKNGVFISHIYDDYSNSMPAIYGLAFNSSGNLFFSGNNNRILQYIPPDEPIACFNKNTKILTNVGYIPIQDLKIGDLVITLKHGYKRIVMIGYKEIQNVINNDIIKDKLYICTNKEFPEIFEDLIITGCHSILVDNFKEEEREKTIQIMGCIFVTDNKLRLPACVDKRAYPYDKNGLFTIYHIALENNDYYMNYGIYANGLIVETCSKRYLKEISGMTLVE